MDPRVCSAFIARPAALSRTPFVLPAIVTDCIPAGAAPFACADTVYILPQKDIFTSFTTLRHRNLS